MDSELMMGFLTFEAFEGADGKLSSFICILLVCRMVVEIGCIRGMVWFVFLSSSTLELKV